MAPTPVRKGSTAGIFRRLLVSARKFVGLGLAEIAGIDAGGDAAHGGIGQPRRLEIGLDAALEIGQRIMRQPAHVLARRLMAEDQHIGLGAMQQPHADAGIRRVEERALPLHEIPMIGIIGGREPFHRAGDEIGDHGIDGELPRPR